jgi:hypothetical protein
MTFPYLVENTNNITDQDALLTWVKEHAASFKTELDKQGALLFRGFPINSAENFDAFSAAFGYDDFTHNESLSNAVRINLTPRVFTANEAPPNVEIFLHHEMAQTPIHPEKIFFCCLAAAEKGGATPLCRSDHLYSAFKSEHPDWAAQFKELGLKYTTHIPATDDNESGQGRSWRSTLSVASKVEAENRLKDLGYSWQWQPDESLIATTPALPAVRELPDGGESFFNQVLAAYCGWKPVEDNGKPVLTFGNGEHIPKQVLDSLVQLSKNFIYPAEWQDGDIALIDNHRVMHGRYPYSGSIKRQVVVCLARS